MSIHSFREKVNLYIYGTKDAMLKAFQLLSLFVSIAAVGTLVHYYGFPIGGDELKNLHIFIIKSCFGFYVLNYAVRFFYTFEPRKFFRSTWFECFLVLLIVLDGFSGLFNLTPVQSFFKSTGFYNYRDLYLVFIQFFVLILILMELAKATELFSKIFIDPATLFILSFIFLISVGTGLLILPEMTVSGKGMPLFDAMFTAISASCVTGLIVVDTATYFTLKGKIVIMLLIQFGGLNIISFATFFGSFTSKGIGLKHQTIMQEYFSSESLLSTKGLLRKVILMTVIMELTGTFMIFSLWSPELVFTNIWEKIFYSVFHSISAFNNAGFSLFTNGLSEPGVGHSYILHLAFIVIVFMGSLGFPAIRDIFSAQRLRERLRIRWKSWSISTQISLYMSIFLAIGGGIVFYLIEYSRAHAGQTSVEAFITALFHSVSARTSGFNTIDFSVLHYPTLILMIFLMFIGGSTGSTAGGIKTSTFFIILLSVYSTIRGKKNLEILNHNISFEMLNRAFSILIFSLTFVFFGTFALSIFEPGHDILALAFEEVSAFATCGLSTGLTSTLSHHSKIVIMVSMFIGRVGTLTLAFALSRKVATTNYKYPSAHFMVG